jgi:hypothetical protein
MEEYIIPYNDNTCINTNLENIPRKNSNKTCSSINSNDNIPSVKKNEYLDSLDNKNSLNV